MMTALAAMPLLLSGAASSAAKPAMNWTVLNLPPFTSVVNGHLGDGIIDGVVTLLERELPQYEAHYETVNIARALLMLDAGEPACYMSAVWTPDRDRKYFTSRITLTPPLQLIVRASMQDRLPRNAAGEVLVESLLTQHSTTLRGLVINQRSYSPAIDTLVQKYRQSAGLITVNFGDSSINVMRMLSAGRADYSFEHDSVLAYNLAQNPQGLGPEALVAVPIAGVGPFYAAILCPHTPWGRERILAIDAALSRLARGREYRAMLDRWRTPQTVQRYRAAQDEFYRERATPSPVERYKLP